MRICLLSAGVYLFRLQSYEKKMIYTNIMLFFYQLIKMSGMFAYYS